jgi:alpha-tubulin suppressor-like RCC1 family protein
VVSSLAGPTSTSDDTACRLNVATVECWGDNYFAQLGNNSFEGADLPQVVSLPAMPREVVVGDQHTCVRMVDNSVYCWGENIFGQTGSGLLGRRASPGAVAFP